MMRIITWNLDYWKHRSLHNEAWIYLRDKIKPDVALLQEVSPPNLEAQEHFLFKITGRRQGTAIYTRNLPTQEFEVALPEKYVGRVVATQIEVSAGLKVVVMSVHAPIIKGRVFPYLDEIFDKIEYVVSDQTFVVGGDLNTARLAEKVWPGYGHGPFFERLAQSVFFDCHRKFHVAEEQTYFRSDSKQPYQDDHLFVSCDLADRVVCCDPIKDETTLKVSDHIPLLVEIAI